MYQLKRCQSCGGWVKISPFSPNSDPQINGVHLYVMDEDFEDHHLGVLCKDCAFTLCDMGEIHLGFGGGNISDLSLWDAHLETLDSRNKTGVE